MGIFPTVVWKTYIPSFICSSPGGSATEAQLSHAKTKNGRKLSIESWVLNRDPYYGLLLLLM